MLRLLCPARRALVLSLGLLGGCAGDDAGTSEGSASTTASTTSEMSSTSASSASSSTGSSSSSASSSASSSSTTDATTGETTSDTSGPPACAAIIDSTDCVELAAVSPDLTLEECETCQGAACNSDPLCDQYPCVDGSIVLRGCCTDADCDGLAPFCGMYIATNNICVDSDDI